MRPFGIKLVRNGSGEDLVVSWGIKLVGAALAIALASAIGDFILTGRQVAVNSDAIRRQQEISSEVLQQLKNLQQLYVSRAEWAMDRNDLQLRLADGFDNVQRQLDELKGATHRVERGQWDIRGKVEKLPQREDQP